MSGFHGGKNTRNGKTEQASSGKSDAGVGTERLQSFYQKFKFCPLLFRFVSWPFHSRSAEKRGHARSSQTRFSSFSETRRIA
ncbi:MAG: hypothetical protein ACKO85_21405, partial [Isosphaeraceae bacterium]